MERIALTKKIRFEVFKRDKFTCNYCGRKAPDVVLQVDHIEPVAKGGENDIANLITSCYECNIGKSDRPLSDNAVVEKQRKQLEMLQERREQIELMFEWKKSLSKLDDKTLGMIKEYADAKINPYSINESGKAILGNLLRRYGANEVLEAIDVSATTYLKFLNDGKLDQTSAEIFLNKIGGILFNRRLKPIDQKLAFIKNKAKNSFNYYDSRRHAILLNRYIITLRRHWHYNDDAILKDLDSELLPKLEEMSNWTEWCELLESWIESIEKKADPVQLESPKDKPQDQLETYCHITISTLRQNVVVMDYMLKAYPDYSRQKFEQNLYNALVNFIEEQKKLSPETIKLYSDIEEREIFIQNFAIRGNLKNYWSYDWAEMFRHVGDSEKNGNQLDLLVGLEHVIEDQLCKMFDEHFYFDNSCYSSRDLPIIRDMIINQLNTLINT